MGYVSTIWNFTSRKCRSFTRRSGQQVGNKQGGFRRSKESDSLGLSMAGDAAIVISQRLLRHRRRLAVDLQHPVIQIQDPVLRHPGAGIEAGFGGTVVEEGG